ncbi:MAG: translation initiation factor IF-3, partial [Clostridiales bacterium]|nr:translation initiation factor IF-3 [Clostridiales bacterium]
MEVSAINKDELMINEEIRDKEVRLIDEAGGALGIM